MKVTTLLATLCVGSRAFAPPPRRWSTPPRVVLAAASGADAVWLSTTVAAALSSDVSPVLDPQALSIDSVAAAVTTGPQDALADVVATALSSEPSSLLLSLAGSDSWRQYVPLVVCVLVIGDILMGSPAANAVLNLARPKDDDDGMDQDAQNVALGQGLSTLFQTRTTDKRKVQFTGKERVNIDSIAKAAVERAEGVKELRNYLDARKTDWDRMEEIRREQDRRMEELDRKNSQPLE